MISLIATFLMTKTSLGPKAAKLASWAALAALVIAFLAIGKCSYDRSVIEKHGAKVERADAKADAKAITTTAEKKGEIDASNERAKAAAADSPDPLKSAFDSLRAEKAGSDKAPR